MKKIVVGGQIDKEEVKALVLQYGLPEDSVEVKSDLDAAMAIKSGTADYYIGACNTGGGGALAMEVERKHLDLQRNIKMMLSQLSWKN